MIVFVNRRNNKDSLDPNNPLHNILRSLIFSKKCQINQKEIYTDINVICCCCFLEKHSTILHENDKRYFFFLKDFI